jgi:hypothetical protein
LLPDIALPPGLWIEHSINFGGASHRIVNEAPSPRILMVTNASFFVEYPFNGGA